MGNGQALAEISKTDRAIAQVKTPPEANVLRRKIKAVQELAPKRHENFDVAFKGACAYCEVSAKAGALWAEVEDKKPRGNYSNSGNFPNSITVTDAGFGDSHDATVCQRIGELTAEERKAYYHKCENDGKLPTLGGMYAFWRERVEQQRHVEPILPPGTFECIVVDPPWAYETAYDLDGRRVASPYPEMNQAELLDMVDDVQSKSSADSILFLWTTQRFIWDAKQLLDRWGFEYRPMFVWDKVKIGMGDLIRMQCEFCLIGIRGHPILSNPQNIRDLISVPRREHSRKPEEFYRIVDSLVVGRKLDWFSTTLRDGWEVYGNDIFKF